MGTYCNNIAFSIADFNQYVHIEQEDKLCFFYCISSTGEGAVIDKSDAVFGA